MKQSNDIKDPKSTLYTVLTTGPYMDMMNVIRTNIQNPCVMDSGFNGVQTGLFVAPMGNGHAPFIALKGVAFWTRKAFDNPNTMTRKDLEIVSDIVNSPMIVKTFTHVTGEPVEYKSVTMDEFFDLFENAGVSVATNAARPTGSWRKTFGRLFPSYATIL
ncbi:hypothetical protein BS47DRAFT_1356094 [Hydnum rufescens UP504]|uniref:Uncharacterized protein n=1 Tax=Hydnum rufescens UP504 TaxID=1448309 RepID=A0A9P6DFG1_9AGAM|nr:hypothetical protein BS47DRAFT_1356094 [Hydnum rufescens UP504]